MSLLGTLPRLGLHQGLGLAPWSRQGCDPSVLVWRRESRLTSPPTTGHPEAFMRGEEGGVVSPGGCMGRPRFWAPSPRLGSSPAQGCFFWARDPWVVPGHLMPILVRRP